MGFSWFNQLHSLAWLEGQWSIKTPLKTELSETKVPHTYLGDS